MSLDSVESEQLVGYNRAYSSLVEMSALSLVLVKVYWLDNKGLSLVCHQYWLELLAR